MNYLEKVVLFLLQMLLSDNKYSSIDFDLSGIDEELKLTVDDALDTNSYKMAFYRGIQDGMRDLRKRVAKMAVNKEQTI